MPETVPSFSKCHNIGKRRALDSAREEGIAPKQFPRKSALRNEWGSWEKKKHRSSMHSGQEEDSLSNGVR